MGNFELTPEILSKASQCETAEEILTKAKEYGEDITLEQAQRVFDMSHTNGAVSDEELDNVSGGSGCFEFPCCPKCKTNAYVKKLGIAIRKNKGYGYECDKCGMAINKT